MADKSVYVSFHPQEYRFEKSEVLKLQVSLLKIEKHLRTIKKLKSKKEEQKKIIHDLIGKLVQKIDLVDNELPEVKTPKGLSNKVKSSKKETSPEENIQRIESDIDSELEDISQKLARINGQ